MHKETHGRGENKAGQIVVVILVFKVKLLSSFGVPGTGFVETINFLFYPPVFLIIKNLPAFLYVGCANLMFCKVCEH